MIILTIPLLLSFSRSSVAFIVLSVMAVFLIQIYKNRSSFSTFRAISAMLILILVIVSAFYFLFWRQHFDVQEQLNAAYIAEYFFHRCIHRDASFYLSHNRFLLLKNCERHSARSRLHNETRNINADFAFVD